MWLENIMGGHKNYSFERKHILQLLIRSAIINIAHAERPSFCDLSYPLTNRQ
jgi:hypothetical protein